MPRPLRRSLTPAIFGPEAARGCLARRGEPAGFRGAEWNGLV